MVEHLYIDKFDNIDFIKVIFLARFNHQNPHLLILFSIFSEIYWHSYILKAGPSLHSRETQNYRHKLKMLL
jgi:hypothetical protein